MNHLPGDESTGRSGSGCASGQRTRAPCGGGSAVAGEVELCGVPPHLSNKKARLTIRILVDDEQHLDDLLAFLRRNGCIALRADDRALQVHLPETKNAPAERLELGFYLSAWQATHPEADATLVD